MSLSNDMKGLSQPSKKNVHQTSDNGTFFSFES